jgi:hypothetical protein
VYVYRDTSGPPDDLATAAPGPGAQERDSSYWYDLSGEDSTPVQEEGRGPFEPLVSSNSPPPGGVLPSLPTSNAAPAGSAPGAGTPAGPAPAAAGRVGRHAAPEITGSDRPEDSAQAQARRLEQIKDFYLTAEAIGEQNVDKHFDQLMTQQRELISEYFKQSNAAQPGDARTAPEEPNGPGSPGPLGSPPEPAPSASVSGEKPRTW